MKTIADRLFDFFSYHGAYVVFDGQYGSTGKGLINSVIAHHVGHMFDAVQTNAAPNSGHTFYHDSIKHVLKQLPVLPVYCHLNGVVPPITVLNAGAIIDPDILRDELDRYSELPIHIHPMAAVLDSSARSEDELTRTKIASTGQGTGPAMARKIRRLDGLGPVVRGCQDTMLSAWGAVSREQPGSDFYLNYGRGRQLIEVSQGFSLGVNSGFYPHTTFRECSVAQALSDAGVAPSVYRGSIMSVRTYPIRVGNTQSTSGPCYPDQQELSWDEIGVEPEITTVTGRPRRVFTWSESQFVDALMANRPEGIFVNFMNYLPTDYDHRGRWLRSKIIEPYRAVMGMEPQLLLTGCGPKIEDVDWIR